VNLTSLRRRFILEVMLVIMAMTAGIGIIYIVESRTEAAPLQFFLGLVFTLAIVGVIWLFLDPDTHAARQSDELLKITSKTSDAMREGLTPEAAQTICELLLPATPAMAIAITDRKVILGYAGYNARNNQPGRAIRTTATHGTLEDGMPRVLHNTLDIGLPASSARISAAIIQPLFIGSNIAGTLKFYYRRSSQLSQTQQSLAYGFAELLSTQMAAHELENQIKLTTSMELKALQAQINPHFLFNTINTIASLIRTDPTKARELLREFAVFYRSTLEDANDLIHLERELKQVERYIGFEVARFGEDRLELVVDVDPDMLDMSVPSFLLQPLAENCVKHAMRAEGKLTITIDGHIEEEYIVLRVSDDGIGMSEEAIANMMSKESDTGLGIAVKNVLDRIHGYYGAESSMAVTSELDKGTVITFTLNRAIAEGEKEGYLEGDDLQVSTVPSIPEPIVE